MHLHEDWRTTTYKAPGTTNLGRKTDKMYEYRPMTSMVQNDDPRLGQSESTTSYEGER